MVCRGVQWKYVLVKYKASTKPDGSLVIQLYSGTLYAKTKYFFVNTQSGVKTIEYFHCTCMITHLY